MALEVSTTVPDTLTQSPVPIVAALPYTTPASVVMVTGKS